MSGHGDAHGHGHGGKPWAAATEHERLHDLARTSQKKGIEHGEFPRLSDVFTQALGKNVSVPASEGSPEEWAKFAEVLAEYNTKVAAIPSGSAKADNASLSKVVDGMTVAPVNPNEEWVLETTEDGLERPSFVPSFATETRVINVKGESIIVPQLHETLEWVMSSPMDYHTFEEVPGIKEPKEDEHDDKKAAH